MTSRKVLFMDIDNCLYSKNLQIAKMMGELIDQYFQTHLTLSPAEAYDLHHKYYKEYGLAILGLVYHHQVDAMDFNAKVDDALSLEDILKPDPKLRKLFEDIDKSKVKLWLLTNAYKTHGERVVKLLQVDDLFEGITFCDYTKEEMIAKPQPEMFHRAMREAEVEDVTDCYFVDDSYINAKGATNIGWNAVHFVEPHEQIPEVQASKHQIRDLEELRNIFPSFFQSQ